MTLEMHANTHSWQKLTPAESDLLVRGTRRRTSCWLSFRPESPTRQHLPSYSQSILGLAAQTRIPTVLTLSRPQDFVPAYNMLAQLRVFATLPRGKSVQRGRPTVVSEPRAAMSLFVILEAMRTRCSERSALWFSCYRRFPRRFPTSENSASWGMPSPCSRPVPNFVDVVGALTSPARSQVQASIISARFIRQKGFSTTDPGAPQRAGLSVVAARPELEAMLADWQPISLAY